MRRQFWLSNSFTMISLCSHRPTEIAKNLRTKLSEESMGMCLCPFSCHTLISIEFSSRKLPLVFHVFPVPGQPGTCSVHPTVPDSNSNRHSTCRADPQFALEWKTDQGLCFHQEQYLLVWAEDSKTEIMHHRNNLSSAQEHKPVTVRHWEFLELPSPHPAILLITVLQTVYSCATSQADASQGATASGTTDRPLRYLPALGNVHMAFLLPTSLPMHWDSFLCTGLLQIAWKSGERRPNERYDLQLRPPERPPVAQGALDNELGIVRTW